MYFSSNMYVYSKMPRMWVLETVFIHIRHAMTLPARLRLAGKIAGYLIALIRGCVHENMGCMGYIIGYIPRLTFIIIDV